MEHATQQQEPISILDWLITLIITAIPVIGFIMLFVWSFGGGTHPNKSNWAKAMLIMFLIGISFYLFIFLVIGFGAIASGF